MNKEFVLLFILFVCVYLYVSSRPTEPLSTIPHRVPSRKKVSFGEVVIQRKYDTTTGAVGPDERVRINDMQGKQAI